MFYSSFRSISNYRSRYISSTNVRPCSSSSSPFPDLISNQNPPDYEERFNDCIEVRIEPVTTAFNLSKFGADKTISGEYVLERPPKKPGGISSAIFLGLVMNLCLHVDYAEASSVEVNHHPTSERDYVSYLL